MENNAIWIGKLESCASFDRALTADELMSIYRSPFLEAVRALDPVMLMYHLPDGTQVVEREGLINIMFCDENRHERREG